jgi:hypothetical protein
MVSDGMAAFSFSSGGKTARNRQLSNYRASTFIEIFVIEDRIVMPCSVVKDEAGAIGQQGELLSDKTYWGKTHGGKTAKIILFILSYMFSRRCPIQGKSCRA